MNMNRLLKFRNKKTHGSILLIIFLNVSVLYGQIIPFNFTDASSKLPRYTTYSTWLQKAVADMNADGRDDIIRGNELDGFSILKQNADGSFTEQFIGKVKELYRPLSVIVADLDNDDYPEILTGGQYRGVYIFKTNNGGADYTLIELPDGRNVFTQASAIADINNDGLLDIFVCHDEGMNAIWRNTGNANFIPDLMGFDFSSIPTNRRRGNYGIVFTDVNNDGYQDAYLSKCYSPLFEPTTDSTFYERINQLFINNSYQSYTDKAKSLNMADGRQTWITEFQDIDNDGDMDAFIANHGPSPSSRLMLNDGNGNFTEITGKAGLSNAPFGILQALMRDFDNDGYVDLLLGGHDKPKIYRNNGNLTFSEVVYLPIYSNYEPATERTHYLHSFAIGDLNHDGFLDIYGSYRFNQDSPDKLWLNQGNNNHFLSITLVGSKSNRSAVGAKITIKVGGQTMIREVRAGESYGLSNTLTQVFGLGNNTKIDELSIRWPSGLVEKKTVGQLNSFLTFYEPNCEVTSPELELDK
jgi:hypothetical protein